MTVYGAFRRIGRAVVDFLYPPICLLCRSALPDGSRAVCSACWDRVVRVEGSICRRCGAPLAASDSACRYCAGRSFIFRRARVFALFDETVQALVHQIKYRHKAGVARDLGRRMGDVLATDDEFRAGDALVPVPLHPSRQRSRGFNQSAELAAGMAETAGIPVMPDLLRRTRKTVTQTGLDAAGRQSNVAGAFAPGRGMWPKELDRVILIDDVLTTGATLNACAEVCRAQGVGDVLVMTAARA